MGLELQGVANFQIANFHSYRESAFLKDKQRRDGIKLCVSRNGIPGSMVVEGQCLVI
jgi:hypothetical protein